MIERFTRMTAGLGIEMVMLRGRLVEDGVERERVLRLFNPAGRGVVRRGHRPADRPAAAARRGRPADRLRPPPRHAAPGRDRQAAGADPAGDFVEHDLDEDGDLVPVDRPPRHNTAGIVVGLIRNRTDRHPEGMLRVACSATRHARSARSPSPSAGGSSPRSISPRSWRAVRVVRRLRRARRSPWTPARRTWTGWPRRCAGSSIHPGRRRDQRRRQRHQRRRPAVLERRGDDADAHARHPRHDPGERDGADRQAGARLLRRRLGRGQLRHRRLRADHGPERPGAVLGARHRRRLRAPAALLRAHLCRAGRALPAPRGDRPTRRPRRARRAARRAGLRPAHGRRDLRRGDQPGPQEAVRHPRR